MEGRGDIFCNYIYMFGSIERKRVEGKDFV